MDLELLYVKLILKNLLARMQSMFCSLNFSAHAKTSHLIFEVWNQNRLQAKHRYFSENILLYMYR